MVLNDEITVVVTRVSRSRVSIAIEAPNGVSIRRGELIEDLPAANQIIGDSMASAIPRLADASDAATNFRKPR
jgi:carbon storage regulator CsrA